MKFIFMSSNELDEDTLEMKFEAETISEVLERVDMFLRGNGYYPNGTLQYIEEESMEDYE